MWAACPGRCGRDIALMLVGVLLRQLWLLGSQGACDVSKMHWSKRRPALGRIPSLQARQSSVDTGAVLPRLGPPSVLITMLDDAGAGDAGALGHPVLLTPHIDLFAVSAIAFSQAYGGAPTCSPSRAALLTGRSPYRTGVYDFLSSRTGDMHLAWSERTIANLLRSAGYATAHFGKWHLSRNGNGHSPYHFGFEHSNGSFLMASSLVHICGNWLRQGRKHEAQPFFAYLALWEPQEPVHYWSPRRLRQLYEDPSAGPASAAVRQGRSLESVAPAVAIGGGTCAWRLPQRNSPSVYYGAMSQVDEAFGALLGELDNQDLRQNTLVVLASDNGPEHSEANSWGSSGGLRGAKGFVYEGGIRIPLLMQWPVARRKALVVDEPVHLWDMLPTICAIAGVPLPPDRKIDGVSLVPVLGLQRHPNTGLHGQAAHVHVHVDEPHSAGGQDVEDPAVIAEALELQGDYVRTRPYVEGVRLPHLRLPPAQPLPLPRPFALHQGASADACTHNYESQPEVLPLCWSARLERETPLFWGMHRGKGGVQYALRRGPWKLLGGYGPSAARADGPDDGDEVVPWLRTEAVIGHVELYLLTHDPAERVDLAASHSHIVTVLLVQMHRLLRETAREGPDVKGWNQRSVPCPRARRSLNVTEMCCRLLAMASGE